MHHDFYSCAWISTCHLRSTQLPGRGRPAFRAQTCHLHIAAFYRGVACFVACSDRDAGSNPLSTLRDGGRGSGWARCWRLSTRLFGSSPALSVRWEVKERQASRVRCHHRLPSGLWMLARVVCVATILLLSSTWPRSPKNNLFSCLHFAMLDYD